MFEFHVLCYSYILDGTRTWERAENTKYMKVTSKFAVRVCGRGVAVKITWREVQRKRSEPAHVLKRKSFGLDVSFMFFWPRWSDGAAEWLWWPEPRSASERPSLKSWSGPAWRWWAVLLMLTKSRLVRKLWINVRQQLQKAVSKARVDVKIFVYFIIQYPNKRKCCF